jgi:RNA polymerase sigma factor (sigma-70 family)
MNENIKILTDEYLKLFHAFAINRTNNAYEAEELAQETAYQCIAALSKQRDIDDLNAFLWSIAHNTYKRWLYKKKHSQNKIQSDDDNISYIENIADTESNIEENLIKSEDMRLLRRELSLLTNFYRRTLVCFYYDELSIAETAAELDLSVEMVKFYLQKGRNKLKENYIMSKEYGEKSFNPAPFAVYRWTRGGCSVDVWKMFSRKLPCQIALVCYDSPKKIDEICLETGVPAAYIEDELKILVEAELLISPVKDKYRTNFFILRKNALAQLKEQFAAMYEKYIPTLILT